MAKVIDETGKKYGRLLVIGRGSTATNGEQKWICVCDCGNHTEVSGSALRSQKTRSCGCLYKENINRLINWRKGNKINYHHTHCESRSRLYKIWAGMKARCENPNRSMYHRYGGRGISVCNRWQKYENFKEDMGKTYFDGASIERIDNDGNYEPQNCKWIKMNTQALNRCSSIPMTFNGEKMIVSEWAKKWGVSKYTIYGAINRGYTQSQIYERYSKRGILNNGQV